LDGIALGIEGPLQNTFNDIPMTSICRSIEIDLKEMLNEKVIPKQLESVNGFLY
jgi:putative membrane protein